MILSSLCLSEIGGFSPDPCYQIFILLQLHFKKSFRPLPFHLDILMFEFKDDLNIKTFLTWAFYHINRLNLQKALLCLEALLPKQTTNSYWTAGFDRNCPRFNTSVMAFYTHSSLKDSSYFPFWAPFHCISRLSNWAHAVLSAFVLAKGGCA